LVLVGVDFAKYADICSSTFVAKSGFILLTPENETVAFALVVPSEDGTILILSSAHTHSVVTGVQGIFWRTTSDLHRTAGHNGERGIGSFRGCGASLLLMVLLNASFITFPTACNSRGGLDSSTSAFGPSSLVAVHVIDVGWGDSIFIDTQGKDVLIDGGLQTAGPVVLDYLTGLGVTDIDLMIVSHPHSDHVGGLTAILNSTIEVHQVLINNESHPSDFLTLAQQHNLTVANRGQVFVLAENVTLTVLNPVQPPTHPPEDWSGHFNNIVVRLEAGNRSFLFTGDANALVEQSMINAGLYIRSDVLKVAIHGCGEATWENVTSQGFLDRVDPRYALISCDYSNGAGAVVPDPYVAARLLSRNVTIYTTYALGTMIAFTDGMSITFSENVHYPYIAELKGHTKVVYSIAWSPDDTLLASGSKDGTVRIWNTTTWTTERTINAHANGVWSVAWSPDGAMLATGGVENRVRIWDPLTSAELAVLNLSTSPSVYAFSVSWSPDSSRLAVGLSNSSVLIFDAETGVVLRTLVGHTQQVICTCWSPDGGRLASGSIDRSVRIWNVSDGLLIFTLRANTTSRNDINGLVWSLNGETLAAAGQDGNVRLWDPQNGSEIRVLGVHYGWTRGVAWSADSLGLATSAQDYFVRLWDPSTGENLSILIGHLSPIWSTAWSPRRWLLASGSGIYDAVGGDTRVLIWDLRAPVARFCCLPAAPHIGEFALFNASLSSTHGGNIVGYTWNFGDGNVTVTSEPVVCHAFAADGSYTVSLNVTDDEGYWSIGSETTNVLPVCGPTADFAWLPEIPRPNRTVAFDASSSVVGWNGTCYPPIVSYVWDFGDGNITTAASASVAHEYGVKGDFTVKLEVLDADGGNSTLSLILRVQGLLGDVNGDGIVNMLDLYRVAIHYGESPSSPNWDPNTDADENGVVNMLDLYIAALHYGQI